MTPTSIDEATLVKARRWWGDEVRRVVLGPPEGFDAFDGEVRAVEMVAHRQLLDPGGASAVVVSPVFRGRWRPDERDLGLLAQGAPLWLSMWGNVIPHDLQVEAD